MSLKSVKKETVIPDPNNIRVIENYGDARRLILQTMIQLRDGEIPVATGMAIAANMKVLNDNLQAEINAAKLCLLAEERGHDFGKIVGMGKRLIANQIKPE
jgi:hypothetical protein